MHPSVKGWKLGWRSFGDALLPLQEDFPEVIALMRYLVGMVSTAHSGVPANVEASVPGRGGKQETGEFAGRASSDEKSVLLIPLFSRAYCLGSCLKIAAELHHRDPELSILVLEPQGGTSGLPSYLEVISMSALRKGGALQLPGAVFSGSSLWRAVCHVLEKEDILSAEMTRVYGNWKRHLLQWCCLYHYDQRVARGFLIDRGVASIVTINDVVKPAAPMITAANRLGLKTIVLQHGTPGPQSAPFIASEGWVWGETSKRALELFGADSSRLCVMGGLESEGVPQIQPKRKQSPRTLLFLGQWRATRGWGEPFFQEVFDLLARTLELTDGRWKLRVRLHPTDPAEAGLDILSRLDHSGVEASLGESGTSMADELGDADALLSISSSGLMNGIAAGIPTAQILPEGLERRIGPALLDEKNLLRDGMDLADWLELVENDEPALRASRVQVLANRGKVAKLMVRRLREISLIGKISNE